MDKPSVTVDLTGSWLDGVEESYGTDSLEAKFAEVFVETLEKRLPEVINELFTLFARKQADYGPNNIALAGTVGIAVRMGDKMSRLTNLLHNGTLDSPNNESTEDTFMDLAVYPMMALLTYRKIWPTVTPEEAWNLGKVWEYLDEKK